MYKYDEMYFHCFYQRAQGAIMDPTVLRCAATTVQDHGAATGRQENVKVDVKQDGKHPNVKKVRTLCQLWSVPF